MARIFVSHSSKDRVDAASVSEWLIGQGFEEVFLDFDQHLGIPPGDDWEKKLYQELRGSIAVLLLLTRNWFDSKWCFAEFTQARAQGKLVIPVVVTADGNKFIGDNIQKVDLTADRPGGLIRLLDRLRKLSLSGPGGFALAKDRLPYPGLLSFESADAAVYFGREPEVAETIDQLQRLRRVGGAQILFIHGDSGSGKSSLLCAGVLPRLGRFTDDWLTLPSFRPGQFPTSGFRAALLNNGVSAATVDALLNDPTPAHAVALLDALRERTSSHQSTLLVSIDQFEECLTLAKSEDRKQFFKLLSVLTTAPNKVLVVATVRTSDLSAASDAVGIPGEQRLLGPFPLDRLPDIVRKPAELVGIEVEEALIAAISRDATTADSLPLAAFLLRELLQKLLKPDAKLRQIHLADYEAMSDVRAGLPPLEACVRTAATKAIESVDRSKADIKALREAFVPGLVRVNDSGQYSRRPLPAAQIPAGAEPLITAFVDQRLLVRRSDGAIEVAHEAIFRVWPDLVGWLADERDFLIGRTRIEAALADYQSADKSQQGKALLQGLLLDRAEAWLAAHPQRFDGTERKFIEDSIAERDAARRKRRRVQRIITGSSVAIAVIVVLPATIALRQRNEAISARRTTAEALRSTRNALATAKEQRQLAEEQAYFVAVAAAAAAEERDQPQLARQYLLQTVAPKGWEWGYLFARSDVSDEVLRGHENHLQAAAFDLEGKRVVTASNDNTARVWDVSTGRELATLRGHEGWVFTAQFSPDGTRVVTASEDKTARIWEAATGRQITLLRGHDKLVWSAQFSPDGERVVTASGDKSARVWDAASGRELIAFRKHTDEVRSAGFSRDGKRVVTGSNDKTARVWDAGNGRELAICGGHTDWVQSAEFSPDGNLVVTASQDATARVWDAASGRAVAIFRGHDDQVQSAAFSPDSKRVVTSSNDKTARVWDVAGSDQVAVLRGHTGKVFTATFSSDGNRVLSASEDRTARVWDAASGAELSVLRGHSGSVVSAAFSPDGNRVVTASEDNTARVWNSVGTEVVLRVHGVLLQGAAFSQDGTKVVARLSDNTARVWDSATGTELAVLRGHDALVSSAMFSPDGTRVVTASGDNTARVWDLSMGQQLAVFRGHDAPLNSARFSPDGTHLVSTSDDKTAHVWDAATGRKIAPPFRHDDVVLSAEFSPDGRRVVTGSEDMTARVWDATTGGQIAVLRGHQKMVWGAVFSPDGSRVATASEDTTARVWDAASGRLIAELRGHGSPVFSATFSPDGTRVATASFDDAARVWNAATGQCVAARLRGHDGPVRSEVFSPDGTRIVTSSDDKTARVWDVATGRELVVLRGHEGPVQSAAFSPGGTRILTVSKDGTARIYDSIPAADRFRAAMQQQGPSTSPAQ